MKFSPPPATKSLKITVPSCSSFRSISLHSLLNPLPAFHLADHFDISSVWPQNSPHVFDILGRADEAGKHHVHALGHPKPQVGLVSLADRLHADQVTAGEVNAFTTAQHPTGLHLRIYPVRACRGGWGKENKRSNKLSLELWKPWIEDYQNHISL